MRARGTDRELPARRHRVARVDHEVEQRIFELVAVRQHRPEIGRMDDLDKDRRPHRPAHQILHRSEEHTSELQSLMRISYAVFCLKKKTTPYTTTSPGPHRNNTDLNHTP